MKFSKNFLSYTQKCFSLNQKFALHKLKTGPNEHVSITKYEALNYYKQMQTIRKLELQVSDLYKQNYIRGYVHLSIGQEGVCVGLRACMTEQDSLISGYRIHGYAYVMGISLVQILGELTGKKIGCSKGKGGSMHMYSKNFYGGHGIVGAQVPIGAGIALKYKYIQEPYVCIVTYGDGAANQGQVFETYNMAKLWNLPLIFVCENNGIAMGTSVERHSASSEFYKRGDFVPGIRADGTDLLAVKEAACFAREYVLKNGPIILELVTYRLTEHSLKDPENRDKHEIEEAKEKKDAIKIFSNRILENNFVLKEELDEIDNDINKEIYMAKEKAIEETESDVNEMYNHVYINPANDFKIRSCDNFNFFKF